MQRWADYRAERGTALSACQPLALAPGKGRALLVLDGKHLLELLDCFDDRHLLILLSLLRYSPDGSPLITRTSRCA